MVGWTLYFAEQENSYNSRLIGISKEVPFFVTENYSDSNLLQQDLESLSNNILLIY
ncbi:hypothetical protein ACTXGU_13760 [Niallia sp. 01092]|uniref:hypothetical protein n=1 Tax=Niallia sp. 01092 TaxID=3457759 RepID=UPI003FD6690E